MSPTFRTAEYAMDSAKQKASNIFADANSMVQVFADGRQGVVFQPVDWARGGG